eukprot:m.173227 g.173227  ORF g.173227 m.173227 type:complete len:766 (+) comp17867_c1_seq2:212-2509(+)
MPLVGVVVLMAAAMGASLVVAEPTSQMNKVEYTIANALVGHDVRDFLGSPFFEVYSPPLRSRYSQVFWKLMDPVPLPEHIIKRYNGSAMAVTGYEVDVVRRVPDPNGTLVDVSVPCYESYNHHFTAFMHGDGLKVEPSSYYKQPGHGLLPGHGLNVEFVPTSDTLYPLGKNSSKTVTPAVQAFNEHNGNEARQSYHGLPRNMVQPIVSPQTFTMGPMQINTKNPDGSGKRGGPLPAESQAPPHADYSGILECPCTTRTHKVADGYKTASSGTCQVPARLHDADACFLAAATLGFGPVSANLTATSPSLPAGCSVRAAPSGLPNAPSVSLEVVFNTLSGSDTQCSTVGDQASRVLARSQSSLVTVGVDIDVHTDLVTLTLTGPADVWFAVGFNATQMADEPWTVVVDAADGPAAVHERHLGNHMPGTSLPSQLTVVANSVNRTHRTVVVTRPLAAKSPSYLSFAAAMSGSSLPFINAVGATQIFGTQKHRQAASAQLSFFGVASKPAASGAMCVCSGGSGTINGRTFNPRCMGEPLSDLLKQHNPTCDINTYRGGLYCCSDGTFILDANQTIPDPVDEVYFKWRFYHVPFEPETQTPLIHLEWQFGHIEYDVPRAPLGTPPDQAIHELTTRFQLRDLMNLYGKPGCNPYNEYYCADVDRVTKSGVRLVMAGAHCHSPACLSVELYNEDTGQLVCRVTSVPGTGDEALNERGYLWLPPCQWGAAEDGLQQPPVLHLDTNLTSIKRVNSTYGHTGVMAIWQARGAYND